MGLLKSVSRALLRNRTHDKEPSADVVPPSPSDLAGLILDVRTAVAAADLSAALAVLDDAVVRHGGDDPDIALARGVVLRAWGREVEAVRALQGASSARLVDADGFHALAWAAERLHRLEDAGSWWARALALDPHDAQATFGRARAWFGTGRVDEALTALEAATRMHPANGEGALLLADVHRRLGRPDRAEEDLRRGIAACPDDAGLLRQLAVVLSSMHRDDEALDVLERARASCKSSYDMAETSVNIAIGLRFAGRLRERLDLLLSVLPQHPVLNGHLELGPALLSFGEFAEGWRQYEHRWFVPPLADLRADYGAPQWLGQPLDNRTILVRCEQGFGDTFQFARYLPMLKARGAHVLLLPLRGLAGIARRFPGVDRVVEEGVRLPPIDYYANLLSLPMAFGTTVDTIPADVPYLTPDPARAIRWAARLKRDDKPLVGLIWAGRPEHLLDRRRSVSLDQLASLLDVEGVRFVSLQKGPAAVQGERVPERIDWDPIGAELDDFEDAAAVLSNLDLLVCVDTGPAHLAAAMGRDVWTLLPTPSDYRWLVEREDTPWYPTMRLFRQQAPGQWAGVIDDVTQALRAWVAERPTKGSGRDRRQPAQGAYRAPRLSTPPGLARAIETRAGFLQYFPDEPDVGSSLEYYGEWLQPALELVQRLVVAGGTLIEAGAGVGAHTLPLSRWIHDHGTLLTWEAHPPRRSALELNLACHGRTNVTVMTRSLGGPAERDFGAGRETIDDLRLAALDGIVLQHAIDGDVILAGAEASIWRCRPWIAAASLDAARLDRLREFLREFGYGVRRMRVPLYSPANFNRRDDDRFGGRSADVLVAVPEERDAPAALPGCEPWP